MYTRMHTSYSYTHMLQPHTRYSHTHATAAHTHTHTRYSHKSTNVHRNMHRNMQTGTDMCSHTVTHRNGNTETQDTAERDQKKPLKPPKTP